MKETQNSFSLLREVWEWIYTIIIALLVVFILKAFIFDIVRVDGPSMHPTLVNNDRLIVTKLGYKPEAGDIIILDSSYKDRQEYYAEYEENNGENLNFFSKMVLYTKLPESLKRRYYVKRIIGMPGDTVDIKDGQVWVNGEVLNEPYYDGITGITDYSVSYPVTVEEGHVFVMGDNRPNSKDSRSSDLGLVPINAIEGKSQLRIWPFTAFGPTE
ncbi:MAG: signal peptidase I [Clostridia bacterium]|nr:signal peptidase I [Clostridia bacterium]